MSCTPGVRRRIVAACALTTAGLLLAACSGDSDGDTNADCTPIHDGLQTVSEGVLTVASYDFPPFTVVEGDNLGGIEGDLLQEIAKRECLQLNVLAAGGAGASIPAVEDGRADLAAGSWTRTRERAETVRQSTPVMISEDAIISKEGLTVDGLEGKKVGSVVGNLWNESFQEWLGDDFSTYEDEESIYGDLAAGRIDAIIANSPTATLRLQGNPIDGAQIVPASPHPMVPAFEHTGQVNWPSSLDNEELGDAIDANILTLREEGVIAQVLESYGVDTSLAETGEPFDRSGTKFNPIPRP